MSILLDALKKAEARKRQEAAHDGQATASEPVTPAGLSLEPMTAAPLPAPENDVVPRDEAVLTTPPVRAQALELSPVESPEPTPEATLDPPSSSSSSAIAAGSPMDSPAFNVAPSAGATADHATRDVAAAVLPPVDITPSAPWVAARDPAPKHDSPAAPATPAALLSPAAVVNPPAPVAPATHAPSADAATARTSPPPSAPTEPAPAAPKPSAPSNNEASLRQQAQTVLSAPRTKLALMSRKRWLYASAGVAALMLLVGGAMLMRQLGVPPFGAPTSLVAQLPPPSAAPAADTAVEATPAEIQTAPDGVTAVAAPANADAAPPPGKALPIAATPAVVPRVEPTASVSGVAPQDQSFDNAPAPPARSPLATPVEDLHVRADRLRVQRRSSPSQLLAGYAALQSGRLDEAESAYRNALSAQPGELDALLGLAVIAEQRGDRAGAETYFRRVLAQQPDHPQAMAALLSNQGHVQGEDEQRLIQSLAEHPDSAVLHAAMGQRMASQQRWSDAQSAYFEAVTREPGNADHLYNLAVALDHLRQSRAAADYYRRAIAQPDPGARFDRQAAAQRLAVLDAAEASR